MTAENPMDELNIQVPGRLITIEVLLVLLLRQKSNKAKVLKEADQILQTIESGIGVSTDYELAVFEAARQSLQNIDAQVLGRMPSGGA